MLTTLRIRNLALVSELTLEFQAGYNAITGETGAGKSILIGALNLVLGERADRTLIRAGADLCTVDAVFDVSAAKPTLKKLLDDQGIEPCENDELVLKRSLSAAGANRQFVNGCPVTLPVLGAVGEWLVDIHGPHEHQSLLNTGRQLAILDAFGGLDAERQDFAALVQKEREIKARKQELVVDERTYAQQLDLLRFQAGEIRAASLKAGEEEEIESAHSKASNASKIIELGQAALALVGQEDGSSLSQARSAGRLLQELRRLDRSSAPLLETLEQAVALLAELERELSKHIEKVDVDPATLAALEERLNLISSLKRKYGPSVSEIIAFGEEAARKLQNLEQRDEQLQKLNLELEAVRKDLVRTGKAISARRRKVISSLVSKVNSQLADLGFAEGRLDIKLLTPPESTIQKPDFTFGGSGLDTVEFLFAPNPGEPPRPLRAIASSGELARVMLALKTVLSVQDQVPVLVFDEVDANVGGQTARAIGQKMSEISRCRQVVCITHSPHVAAPAATHYQVTKQVRNGRTTSDVRQLQPSERVAELARMLGGPMDAATRHARALLK